MRSILLFSEDIEFGEEGRGASERRGDETACVGAVKMVNPF
jgi:hypothetical protein